MALAIKHRGSKVGKVGRVHSGLFGQHNVSPFCPKRTREGAGDKPAPLNNQHHASVTAGWVSHCRMLLAAPHQALIYRASAFVPRNWPMRINQMCATVTNQELREAHPVCQLVRLKLEDGARQDTAEAMLDWGKPIFDSP